MLANIQAAPFGPAGLDSMPREQAQEGWILAYILTADKPVGSPFSSPLGLQLTENNSGWLEVYLKTADKALRLPFSSPLGLQLTFVRW